MKSFIAGLFIGMLGLSTVQYFCPTLNAGSFNCPAQDSTSVAIDSTPKELSPIVLAPDSSTTADTVK